MEDLPGADSPPVNEVGHEPAGNDDPQDPLRPDVEEEDSARTPPIADPHQDTELAEDDQNPQLSIPGDADNDDNDADSDALSDVDEAQFQDFDPNAIAIEERPRVVDASGVALLGKHKRKRDDADGEGKKKRREGRREKPKRSKRGGDDDGQDYDASEEQEGRRRKTKGPGEKRKKRTPSPEDDSNLSPEESEYTLGFMAGTLHLTSTQDARRSSRASWMKHSRSPRQPADVRLVLIWNRWPIPSSRRCVVVWPRPPKPTLKPATMESLLCTSLNSSLRLSPF